MFTRCEPLRLTANSLFREGIAQSFVQCSSDAQRLPLLGANTHLLALRWSRCSTQRRVAALAAGVRFRPEADVQRLN